MSDGSALRSKEIGEYIEAKLSELRPGEPLTFDIHLYFSRNRHIMLWRSEGDVLTDGFLDKYRGRGVEKIYIHRDQYEAYNAYLHPSAQPAQGETLSESDADGSAATSSSGVLDGAEAQAASTMEVEGAENAAAVAPSFTPPPPSSSKEFEPATERGAKIVEILQSKTLTPSQKKSQVAKEAKNMLAESASAKTTEQQATFNSEARKVIKDVLDAISRQAETLVSEIWRLADIEPDLEHSVNVATYAVIFAMGFGRISKSLIQDLALAGLLHDIGLTQVSPNVTRVPWKSFTVYHQKAYEEHVQGTLDLIEAFGANVSERVKAILFQHHEKFDGSGYPRKLQGFKVDDISQLLAMADLLDSIASGQWDGQPRTLGESFDAIEATEKLRTFPEYFNPDVYSAVMKWTKNTITGVSAQSAIDAIKNQTLKILER